MPSPHLNSAAGAQVGQEDEMSNCKVGDLAIIVEAKDVPENIGAIVEVLAPTRGCSCGECTVGPVWLVRSQGRMLKGFGFLGLTAYDHEMRCKDSSLRPIKGDGIEDATEVSKPVEAAPRVEVTQ